MSGKTFAHHSQLNKLLKEEQAEGKTAMKIREKNTKTGYLNVCENWNLHKCYFCWKLIVCFSLPNIYLCIYIFTRRASGREKSGDSIYGKAEKRISDSQEQGKGNKISHGGKSENELCGASQQSQYEIWILFYCFHMPLLSTGTEWKKKIRKFKLENSIKLMKRFNCFDRNQCELIAQYNSENVFQY